MATPLLLGPLDMDSNTKTSSSGRPGTPWYQKALLFALLLSLASFDETFAGRLTLNWDASPDTSVAGYKVYYGPEGGAKQFVNVGNSTRALLTDLTDGAAYEFFVTAYSANGVESDPSNFVSYLVPLPLTGTAYTLEVSGFRSGFVDVSPKGAGVFRDQYAEGALVTLTATPSDGATFGGWNINGIAYATPQVQITMGANTVATPVFKNSVGRFITGSGTVSMAIERNSEGGEIKIGGEAGAWVLEVSQDLANWKEFISGLTSERIALNSAVGNAFFRVRTR
jgi:chitinase